MQERSGRRARGTGQATPQNDAADIDLGYGPRIDQQLSTLYGDSLFGPWTRGLTAAGLRAAHGLGRSPRRRARARVLFFVLLLSSAVGAVVLRGLDHRETSTQREVAERVERLVRVGAVAPLAALLDEPTAGGALKTAGDAPSGLYCRAQATVFRYLDAHRERLCDLDPAETDRSGTAPVDADRLVAALLPLPAAERVLWLDALRHVAKHYPDEPQAHYLLSTALEAAGDLKAAARSLEAAVNVEPTNLIHLRAQARLWRRMGRRRAAAEVIDRMLAISETAPWSLAARAEQAPAGQSPAGSGAQQPEAAEAAAPSVPRAAKRWADAAFAWRGGRLDDARAAAQDAAAAVRFQTPFLIDAVDALVAGGAAPLAQRFVAHERWPHDAAGAAGAAQRVAAATTTTDVGGGAAAGSMSAARRGAKAKKRSNSPSARKNRGRRKPPKRRPLKKPASRSKSRRR